LLKFKLLMSHTTRFISISLLLSLLFGCKHTNSQFPEVKKLTNYKETEFLPTMENQLSNNRNSIYCVTLLYAWDLVKEKINSPLIIKKTDTDLLLLNNSKSQLNALKENEYDVTAKVSDKIINLDAKFSKSLPFNVKFESYTKKMTFNNIRVTSFGTSGHNYEMTNLVEIIYYQDDNNFIIKIEPKDNTQEIILYKTTLSFKTMSEMVNNLSMKLDNRLAAKIANGKNYCFNDSDELVIPKLKFNLEYNYSSLEGKEFKTTQSGYKVETASQRNAFILDENGTKVESEAAVEVTTLSREPKVIEVKPKIKHMIFDKPFFLLLKKADSRNPYFALHIVTPELMIKE